MAASACAALREGWAPGQPGKGTRGEGGGTSGWKAPVPLPPAAFAPVLGCCEVDVSSRWQFRALSLSPPPSPPSARPSGMSRCLKIVHWKERGESGKMQRDKGAEYACLS